MFSSTGNIVFSGSSSGNFEIHTQPVLRLNNAIMQNPTTMVSGPVNGLVFSDDTGGSITVNIASLGLGVISGTIASNNLGIGSLLISVLAFGENPESPIPGIGPQGIQGNQGQQGIQGAQGIHGQQGIQGVQGPGGSGGVPAGNPFFVHVIDNRGYDIDEDAEREPIEKTTNVSPGGFLSLRGAIRTPDGDLPENPLSQDLSLGYVFENAMKDVIHDPVNPSEDKEPSDIPVHTLRFMNMALQKDEDDEGILKITTLDSSRKALNFINSDDTETHYYQDEVEYIKFGSGLGYVYDANAKKITISVIPSADSQQAGAVIGIVSISSPGGRSTANMNFPSGQGMANLDDMLSFDLTDGVSSHHFVVTPNADDIPPTAPPNTTFVLTRPDQTAESVATDVSNAISQSGLNNTAYNPTRTGSLIQMLHPEFNQDPSTFLNIVHDPGIVNNSPAPTSASVYTGVVSMISPSSINISGEVLLYNQSVVASRNLAPGDKVMAIRAPDNSWHCCQFSTWE